MKRTTTAFALALAAVGAWPRSVVAADVNGDGRMDLISANSLANTLSVLFNSTEFGGVFVGTGQFSSASFGANLSQKLNLYNTTFGSGIQNSVLYSRVGVGSGFGWYLGKLEAENGELKARLEKLEQLIQSRSGGGQ
jgi:hypothetical protein